MVEKPRADRTGLLERRGITHYGDGVDGAPNGIDCAKTVVVTNPSEGKPSMGKSIRVKTGVSCLDGAPCQGSCRGFANVSGAVMSSACCAARMAPLALMIRPHGSSPQSPYRARTGADTCTGFKSLVRGSHHLVVALDADRQVSENSPCRALAVVRPRPDGRRTGRPSSSARRRCARPCWRAPPRSA